MRHYIAHRINVMAHAVTDSIVRDQRRRWQGKADRLHDEVLADMTPCMVQSRGRPGVEYQSLAFFQRRMAI